MLSGFAIKCHRVSWPNDGLFKGKCIVYLLQNIIGFLGLFEYADGNTIHLNFALCGCTARGCTVVYIRVSYHLHRRLDGDLVLVPLT